MKLYFAPMEGITLSVFRNMFETWFPGTDVYFSPFLVANQTLHFKNKEIRDILPENNQGISLVPQLLTNRADQFAWGIRELMTYGYREINLNLGCSMPQVAKRGKGAGFLADPEALDRFFDEAFGLINGESVKVSVKMRAGIGDPEEIRKLTSVINRYPFSEVIVHPRLMKELYGGTPHMDAFRYVYDTCVHPVSYNGDVYTAADYERICSEYPKLHAVMIGRGFLRNPGLMREIRGEEAVPLSYIREYHDALFEAYCGLYPDQRQAVTKMKELWYYMRHLFEDREREMKEIKKAASPAQYREAARRMFA